MAEDIPAGLLPAEELSPHDHKLLGPGMPALLLLHEYGDLLRRAFGRSPILCGSVFTTKHPRDVDVRLVLLQGEYREHVGPIWEYGQPGTRWALTCAAFALLGQKVTGLNIDFQVENWAHAAHCYPKEPFLVLGHGNTRTAYPPQELGLAGAPGASARWLEHGTVIRALAAVYRQYQANETAASVIDAIADRLALDGDTIDRLAAQEGSDG